MQRKLLLAVTVLGMLAAGTALSFHPGPSGDGGNPLTRHALDAASHYTLCGRVEERLPAGSYLYLHVRDARGAGHWVATLRATSPAADEVEVRVMARSERFSSRRLGRDFTPLHFGAVSGATSCRTHSTPNREPNP
ncbi:hypothetical protein [Pyxidicoccus xibeiensis]|uniref:hypothetical protein n=1 Tax=Pyxidicoccus xibeiensis TaxID=2906759 RepID=UPI0020A6F219|nr:hypothetical protein [Pyxidicoccus xibeiensis]MCP3143740.1 hypothetical protein [Pyxidicoccus xibeiensis]